MVWKNLGKDPCPPKRKADGFGKVGRPIKLTTNHFPVTVKNQDIILRHYDVTIKDHRGGDRFPKKKKMGIFEAMKQSFPKVFSQPLAFDSGKNAYGVAPIPQLDAKKPCTFDVSYVPEDERARVTPGEKNEQHHYTVTLQKVNQAGLKELFNSFKGGKGSFENCSTIMQMIEVMFRHYRALKYEQVSNRNFYSLNEEFGRASDIGGGKLGVVGFFASLRPASWKNGLTLNVDLAHTAFYKEQGVMEFLMEQMQLGYGDFNAPLKQQIQRNASKAIKGIKVRVTHAQRTYRANGVTDRGADQLMFEVDDRSGRKRNISVAAYFRENYGKNLQYPKASCLHVGNVQKKIYIPIEMCKIEKGQRVLKKLSDRETAVFIRSTAVPPHERLRIIKAAVKSNRFEDDVCMKALTFSISDMPLLTQGRVLPDPELTMKTGSFKPRQGVWDIRDKQFQVAAGLNHWSVISYDFRTQMNDIRRFVNTLVKMGRERGMNISDPFEIYTPRLDRYRDPDFLADFRMMKQKKPELQLIMCILPGKTGSFYGKIKRAGDRELELITQCVQGQNVGKNQPQTVSNILLKINAKMGGTNNIVGTKSTDLIQFNEPFMILGADVNHPPAGDSRLPSLAAVVGSIDKNACRYACEVRAQKHRQEIIDDLTEIIMNLLKQFYAVTKVKPKRIIMYRDGVSESQFLQVLEGEMSKIREACKRLEPNGNYEPGITFICVQKRHHTRLFCDERDAAGRSGNIPPGTIVDRDIVHPTETDFFLCSHQGIQGTSKPTHYHLLWDDNDLPMDELQALTYKLCYVYSRCTRSVSIPTPVYYAHLAAFRAKVYLADVEGSDTMSTTSSGSTEREQEQKLIEYRSLTRVARDTGLSARLYYV